MNDELVPVPARPLRPEAAEQIPPVPYTPERPPAAFPRLGHGIRWSDVVAEMQAERVTGEQDKAA
jgi:hypothetical protein